MPIIGQVITVAVDPANILAGAVLDVDVAIPVAQAAVSLGTQVLVFPPPALEAGLLVSAIGVVAEQSVRFRLFNSTAGAINAAAAQWSFAFIQEG